MKNESTQEKINKARVVAAMGLAALAAAVVADVTVFDRAYSSVVEFLAYIGLAKI
jgi:hypothetical protein